MPIDIRLYNNESDNPQQLFELFKAVYGNEDLFKKRFCWQYQEHPRVERIKILIAEDNNKIVGLAAHLPGDLCFEGKRVEAYFASDSMIHPDYRRQGIMEKMLTAASEQMNLFYAKGTNPGMYKLRLRYGFKDIKPNNFMLKIISPVKWLQSKIGLAPKTATFDPATLNDFDEMEYVQQFDDQFDKFWLKIAPQYTGIVFKDSAFMNWRYLKHPFKKYHAFVRRQNNEISSIIICRTEGLSVKLIDIIWDDSNKTEFQETLESIEKLFKKNGFKNLYCWSTYRKLRDNLKQRKFFEIKETPRFTVYSKTDLIDRVADGHNMHFVEGDGDNDFF